MKHLYLVSYYFAPLGRADGVNRAYLVKYLAECGWDVDIITGEKYRSLVLNFQTDPDLLNILPPKVKINRFKSDTGWLSYDIKKIIGISNNFRHSWIADADKAVKPAPGSVVMAIVPPADNAVLAHRLAQKAGVPLVLFYPDDVLDVPSAIVRQAKLIVCVTPKIKEILEKHYSVNNIVVVEHGYAESVPCPQRHNPPAKVRMVYAGSFNFRTRPEWVAQAFQQFRKKVSQHPGQMEIDFYGPEGYYLSLFLNRYLSEEVRFKGYVTFEKLMKLLPEYDMAVTVNQADFAFPSKVFHYLNAGLPIFAVTEHEGLIDFIRTNQIGLTVGTSKEDIVKGLERILSSKDKILSWRQNILRIKDNFSLSERMKQLDKYLQKLLS